MNLDQVQVDYIRQRLSEEKERKLEMFSVANPEEDTFTMGFMSDPEREKRRKERLDKAYAFNRIISHKKENLDFFLTNEINKLMDIMILSDIELNPGEALIDFAKYSPDGFDVALF